jgi:serine/threonine-protein kinase HipA
MTFEGEVAIVIERYDRQRSGNDVIRVHQEDVCQALAVMPMQKYQNEGGPGVSDVVELLRTHSTAREEDVSTFVDAVGFNWLIAGTDAHAKNYSLLIAGGPRVRLAPLYDLASILPYEDINLLKAKFSMKIGGEYQLRQVGLRQWQKLARELRLNADGLIDRLYAMAEQLPDAANQAGARAREEGLDHAIIDRLTARLSERAKECQRLLATATD